MRDKNVVELERELKGRSESMADAARGHSKTDGNAKSIYCTIKCTCSPSGTATTIV
jgi:hypothetical protein